MTDFGRELSYNDLQKIINSHVEEKKYTIIREVSKKLNVTQRTVWNFLLYGDQIVSDKTYTQISELIGIAVSIVWHKGKRRYFILD